MDHASSELTLTPGGSDDPDALLAVADAHRALGAWEEAAGLYARVVTLRPDAWSLIVQEGHCLKEAGRVAAALERYKAALELAPEDADLHLQLGHALKLLGLRREAAEAYARALSLDPENPDAWQEASASAEWLTEEPPAPALPEPDGQAETLSDQVHQLAFDVTDVLDYFNGARTPTGIQRVQMSILGRALGEPLPEGVEIALVSYDPAQHCWHAVEPARFATLCELAASGSDTEDPDWTLARDTLREAVGRAPALAFPAGTLLVNLGNSWGFPDYFRALREIQRRHGVRYVPFVHDCVPLVVPEHCLHTMVQDYARWFSALGLHAHGLLCNSENTLRDVRHQLQRLMPGLDLPGQVIRLDGDPREAMPARGDTAMPALRVLRPGEPYVLFVATIESRKNHLLVFSAWLALLRQYGPARVPRLVCVGKAGWHAEAALALLRNAPELQRHVVILSRISDLELDALYEHCLFSVYNSHYEGWGLPITEALAHGKAVLTAGHSALTEAGGEAALYFTPQSLPDLQSKLEALIFDPEFRAAQEEKAREKGRPRSWSAIKDQVLDATRGLARQPGPEAGRRAPIELARRYAVRRSMLDRPDLHLASAAATLSGAGWHALSEEGAWAGNAAVGLRLPLAPAGSDAALRLYLELKPAPGCGLPALLCATGAVTRRFTIEPGPGEQVTVMLDLPETRDGGLLEVEFETEAVAEDGRSFCLLGFMICRADDLAARLAYLESQSHTPAQPEA